LNQERNTTDVLLGAEGGAERVDEVVDERREEATQRIQEVRREVDAALEDRLDGLPQVSAELERVAERLSTAADRLGDVADTLKESFGSSSEEGEPQPPRRLAPRSGQLASQLTGHLAEIPKSVAEVSATLAEQQRDVDETLTDLIERGDRADGESPKENAELASQLTGHLAEIAKGKAPVSATLAERQRDVDETLTDLIERGDQADGESPKENAELASQLTSHLAEIAKGMAEVSATLAEKQRDVDETLEHERQVTDRIIVQAHEQVETDLAEDLSDQRHLLTEKRQATDDDLAQERQHTDDAMEHVLNLLTDEEQAHALAERKFATRNEFLAIVSHDLRGPLMGIIGAAQLIEHAPAKEHGARIGEWTTQIRRSAAAMERLILDLLDFRSFEDGELRVVAERHDTADVVRSAMDALQPLAAAKSIALVAHLPPKPVMARYDPHRLWQVLSNLIDNAIKFTPEGGVIRIRTSRTGPECRVAVSDTGIGIPADKLNAIFEYFHHVERTDRTGLGLGLYIATWIVKAHGGRIWVTSRVGGGSTFYFTLPTD
jgi:signal transduction histidine kinase